MDVITYPCHGLDVGLVKLLVKRVPATRSFPNFNSVTVEVWEWISNSIPHLTGMWLIIHVGIKVKPP